MKQKPSQMFEGPNSSLKKTFDEVDKDFKIQVSLKGKRFNYTGYTDIFSAAQVIAFLTNEKKLIQKL